MVPFKKKQPQAVAEINLNTPHSHRKDDSASWLTSEAITGYATYTFPSGLQFTNSKITLKGVVKTSTTEYNNGRLQQSWRDESLEILGVALSSKPRTSFESDNGVVKIPFRFNLRDCEALSSWVDDLPPSIDSKKEGQKASDDQYTIVYSITATAYSPRGVAASTTQRVSVLPVAEELPHPSDCPSEYHIAEKQSHSSKAQRSESSIPRIHIAAQEPSPMVCNDTSSQGSTQIPLVIKLSPSASEGSLDQEILPSRCELHAHLVQSDILTPDRLPKAGPTEDHVRYRGDISVKQHKSQEQHSSLSIGRWDQFRPSPSEPFALTRLSFNFGIKGDKAPLPSFFTPLLSRKYSISLVLSFPEIPGYSWKLALPLDVMYGGNDTHDCDFTRKRQASVVSVPETAIRV